MSQSIVGNLRVNLGLDTAQFDAGAKKAQASLSGLSNSIKGFASGIAGALTLGGVAMSLRTSINRLDELGEAAEKVGMSAEEFSKLEYAARVAGLGMESLTTTMARFSRSISEIGMGGNNDAVAALRSLGISASDAQGQLRPTADIISDIAEEFAAMQDGADKTRLAMDLFGRSGADMIPFLNGGRQAIKDMGDEAEAFGLVVDRESSQAAARFNDNLTRLQGASEGLQRHLARALVPALADVSEGLLDYVRKGSVIEKAVEGIKTEFGDLARAVTLTADGLDRLSEYSTWLDDLARNYGPFSRNAQDGFFGLFDSTGKGDLPAGLLDRVLGKPETIEATRDMLDGMLDSIENFGKPAKRRKSGGGGGGGSGGGGGAREVIPIGIEDIRGPALELSNLTDQLKEADLVAKNLATSLTDGLAFTLIDMAFNAKSAGEAMEMLKRSALDMLQSITETLLRSGLNMLLGNLGTSFGGAQGLAGFGGFYANGGTLGAGKWGIAGEAGPEIIHGPARITPLGERRGVNVQIVNNTPAKVSTKAEQAPDGSINIRALIQDEVLDTMGGGKAARVMGARFGARIAPRRT